MALTRLSPTAGTTVAALVPTIVFNLLKDLTYEDSHSSAPNSSDTTLTVSSDATTRYKAGTYIEWLADGTYERALITAVAATTLTIRRGVYGSTAASHSANAVFRVLPKYWGGDASKAVTDSILTDLYPDIFAVYEETLTAAPTTTLYYTLTANAEDVLRVYQKTDSSTPQDLSFVWSGHPEYVDSTLASTKKGLYIPSLADPDNTIFVQWTRIPAVGDLSDAQARIVEYYAAARLLEQSGAAASGNESLRASGGVSPGLPRQDAAYFRRVADEMKRQEKKVLDRRWPRRKKNYILAPHNGDYGIPVFPHNHPQ